MERHAPCFTFSSTPTSARRRECPPDRLCACSSSLRCARSPSQPTRRRPKRYVEHLSLNTARPSNSLTLFLSSSLFFLLAGEGAYRRLRAQAGTFDRRSMPLPPLDVQHVAFVPSLRPALVPHRPADRHDLHGRRVRPAVLLRDGRQPDQALDLSPVLRAPPPLGTSLSPSFVRTDPPLLLFARLERAWTRSSAPLPC